MTEHDDRIARVPGCACIKAPGDAPCPVHPCAESDCCGDPKHCRVHAGQAVFCALCGEAQ